MKSVQKSIRLGLELLVSRFSREFGRADAPGDGFDRAIAHFGHCHWSRAFEELIPLADAGRGEAARIALLMTKHGPRLFGQAFIATPRQRSCWQEAASRVNTAE